MILFAKNTYKNKDIDEMRAFYKKDMKDFGLALAEASTLG